MSKPLTPGPGTQQEKVIHLRLLGYSVQETAKQLGLSPSTVKTHCSLAFKRMDVHSIGQYRRKLESIGKETATNDQC